MPVTKVSPNSDTATGTPLVGAEESLHPHTFGRECGGRLSPCRWWFAGICARCMCAKERLILRDHHSYVDELHTDGCSPSGPSRSSRGTLAGRSAPKCLLRRTSASGEL